jgi:hypothetical protein
MAAATLHIIEVAPCPLWDDPDGTRRPGVAYEPDAPPVVGWCNVAVMDIGGEPYRVSLTLDAAR